MKNKDKKCIALQQVIQEQQEMIRDLVRHQAQVTGRSVEEYFDALKAREIVDALQGLLDRANEKVKKLTARRDWWRWARDKDHYTHSNDCYSYRGALSLLTQRNKVIKENWGLRDELSDATVERDKYNKHLTRYITETREIEKYLDSQDIPQTKHSLTGKDNNIPMQSAYSLLERVQLLGKMALPEPPKQGSEAGDEAK